MKQHKKTFKTLFFSTIVIVVIGWHCTDSVQTKTIVEKPIGFIKDSLSSDSLYEFIVNNPITLNSSEDAQHLLELRKKIYPNNHTKVAQSYYVLGFISNGFSKFHQAIDCYQQGLNIHKQLGNKPKVVKFSLELASAMEKVGDVHQANDIIEQTLPLINTLELKEDSILYFNLAINKKSIILEKLKEYEKACYYDSIYYQSCNQAFINSKELNEDFANAALNLAIDKRHIGQKKVALFYLQKALYIYQKLYHSNKNKYYIPFIANTHTEVAHTHLQLKDYPKAINNYQTAINILEKEAFSNHRYAAEAQLGISNCLFEQKKYREAFGAAEKAMKILVPDDSIQHAYAPQHYLTAVLEKIKCHKALDSNDLQSLLRDYEDADKLIAYIHQHYNSDNSKFDLTEKSLQLYEEAINTAVALYQQTKDISYFNKAINFSERNKAVILREALQDNFAKKYAGISEEKLQDERNLKIELAYSQKQLFEAATDSSKSVWKSKIFNLQSDIDKFNRDLSESNPTYHKLRYASNNSLTINEIQQNLQNKSLLLEYFLGEKKLYIFAVSQNKYQVYSKDLPDNWDTMLQSIRDAVGNNSEDAKGYLDHTFPLYQFLLAEPLADFNQNNDITRLRVIPDGKLGYISFDYLCTTQPKGWLYEDGPNWLLEQYATSYLYSNTLLKSDKTLVIPSKSIGFGLDYKNRSPLEELTYAPDEAENFANLTYGKAYTNANATLNLFKKEAPNAGIIHLALHGIIDEKNPLNSTLLFTQSPEGDRLSAMEIYNMQLKSGLAVLSACNTGNGKLQRGEGIMSLARAFAFAGCPSMMVSLWSIPDASTSEITKRFYENIKAGMPKDIALQQAKLAYFKGSTPEDTKPNNWAASVIIGDIEPIEIGYPWSWKIAIALSVLALGFGFYYKIVKK